MAKGGKREGAGRPKGSLSKKTQEIIAATMSEGITPLEFMLQILRDPTADWDKRLDAAKSAAPYVHPKLASTELKNAKDETFKASMELIFKSANAKPAS